MGFSRGSYGETLHSTAQRAYVRWNDAAGSVEESACIPCEPGRWLDVLQSKGGTNTTAVGFSLAMLWYVYISMYMWCIFNIYNIFTYIYIYIYIMRIYAYVYWCVVNVLDANFLAHPGRTNNIQGGIQLMTAIYWHLVVSPLYNLNPKLKPICCHHPINDRNYPTSRWIMVNTAINLPECTVPCMEHPRQPGFGRLMAASSVKVRWVALHDSGNTIYQYHNLSICCLVVDPEKTTYS